MKSTKSRSDRRISLVSQTSSDFRNALLIISVLINLFILTTWLVIQVSPDYALKLIAT